jgi:hypothetical protein
MDIVYASLKRRRPEAEPGGVGEVAEALDALWAHATPEDGLQHASGRAEDDRVDLLLYFLTRDPAHPDARSAVGRVEDLLHRAYQNSPLLSLRYLPVRTPDALSPDCSS